MRHPGKVLILDQHLDLERRVVAISGVPWQVCTFIRGSRHSSPIYGVGMGAAASFEGVLVPEEPTASAM
jgi:hypothetical protein